MMWCQFMFHRPGPKFDVQPHRQATPCSQSSCSHWPQPQSRRHGGPNWWRTCRHPKATMSSPSCLGPSWDPAMANEVVSILTDPKWRTSSCENLELLHQRLGQDAPSSWHSSMHDRLAPLLGSTRIGVSSPFLLVHRWNGTIHSQFGRCFKSIIWTSSFDSWFMLYFYSWYKPTDFCQNPIPKSAFVRGTCRFFSFPRVPDRRSWAPAPSPSCPARRCSRSCNRPPRRWSHRPRLGRPRRVSWSPAALKLKLKLSWS